MIGGSAPGVAPVVVQPQTAPAMQAAPGAAPPAPPSSGSALPFQQTMLGVRSPAAPPAGRPAPTPPLPSPPTPGSMNRTMLGVAIPGIAPTRPPDEGAPPPAPPAVAAAAAPAQASPPRRPHAATMPLQVQYVPPPTPLAEVPAPPPPRIVRKKGGVPLAAVALIAAAVVIIAGGVLALLWKGAPPIAAQPHATPDGKDVLHLTCDAKSCKDGTVVTFQGEKAIFAGGAADLPLATPLHVGDNPLVLQVDRPGMGRDEAVKLVVPVGYRIRADVTTMGATHPSITIRVEALPGASVRIDDKPVVLDANGAGAYVIDEQPATEGPADESRVVSVDVPYVVSQTGPKARPPETGTASARVAVAPLRVDAPGARAVVDDDKVLIAGRAAKGATVTVDGAPVTVGADGGFEATVPLPALGDRTVDVRGGTSALMPRTVHVVVTRVASLPDAAKAFEQLGPVGYDAAMRDLTGKTGQPIVVDGVVIESRGSGHRTLVLVDDRRGCARGPCLARVIVGRDLVLAHGDTVRAYGTIARAFTTSTGQTVPEVESQFVVKAKR